jgi:hypothetical protein
MATLLHKQAAEFAFEMRFAPQRFAFRISLQTFLRLDLRHYKFPEMTGDVGCRD